MYRKYCRRYVLFLLLFSLPFTGSALFAHRALENLPFASIAALQRESGAIYGTAFNQNTYGYKLALIRAVRPEVVALGSSRTMQFREQAFAVPFVNAGGAVNNLVEGELFVREMLAVHVPRVVILGVDFWWLNARFPQRADLDYHKTTGTELTFKKLTEPYLQLALGKVSPETIRAVLVRGDRRNHVHTLDNIGVTAIVRGEGFRKDGSRFHGRTLFGLEPGFPDRKLADTLHRIREGRAGFQPGTDIDPDRAAAFERLLGLLDSSGVQVVLFIPPMTDHIRQIMEASGRYAIVDKLPAYLASLGREWHDFHRIADAGSSDCECLDGFHGGDVTTLRMLLGMASQGTALKGLVDEAKVEDAVSRNAGRALALFDGDSYPLSEADFMELGCPK